MRILEFQVKKQRILKKNDCDFTKIVANSVGYLHAKFHFQTNDWSKCDVKVASFFNGNQEFAVTLDKNDGCLIPKEVLTEEIFEVSVTGASKGYSFKTNRTKVKQEVI